MDVVQLTRQMYEFALRRQWHLIEAKWGRTGSASLLSHSLTVMGIAERLADVCKYSEADKKMALALAFLHDAGKEHPDFREKREFSHKDLQKRLSDGKTIEEVVRELLAELGFKEADSIVYMLPHGAIEDIDHFIQLAQRSTARDVPTVRRMVHEDADALASMKDMREMAHFIAKQPHLKSDEDIHLTYHSVSCVRGILTSLVHKTMHAIHESAGWHPVVFFPEGTVYVGRGDKPDLSGFEECFAQELRTFVKELAEKTSLGADAVGSLRAKVIRSPEYLYLSDTTVGQFWERIRRQRAIADPEVKDKLDFPIFERSTAPESEAKELMGLYWMLYYLKAVVEQCTQNGEDKEAERVFREAFEREFPSASEDVVLGLGAVSHTKPIEDKLAFAALFREALERGVMRERLLDDVKDKLAKITQALREFGERHCGFDYRKIAREVAREVSYPPLVEELEACDDVWDAYVAGKGRGTPLCVLCSNKPATDAVASLVGKSQSFSNLLMGGSHIGVGNKYRICSLCDMETKLRSPFLKSPSFVEYYIIPQISLSPEGTRRWAELIDALADGREVGIEQLFFLNSDRMWSSEITRSVENGRGLTLLNTSSIELLTRTRTSMSSKKNTHDLKKTIEQYVKDEYGEEGMAQFLSEVGASELDEAVEMLIQRALPQEHQDKICQRLGDGRGVLMQLITPNYVLVSYPMGDDDVREVQYLRHLFRMVLISRLFVASVVLKEVSYEPLKETVSKGVAYLSTSLGLAKTLEHLGIHLRDGWVSIEDVDSVLKRLSCVLQLASLISMSQPKGREKRGLLLDIINNPAGRTLNELSLLVGNKGTSSLKRAITLFNML